jgi:hypothetical protein
MLRLYASLLALALSSVSWAQDAPSYLLPGRLEAGNTLWTHDLAAGTWSSQTAGLIDLQYQSTTLLSGSECITNRMAGSWIVTDAGLSNILSAAGMRRRMSSARGQWMVMGQLEDGNDAGVIQRTRLTLALGRSIQVSPNLNLRLAFHAGKGWRRWTGGGIWDSQYLSNPVDPAAANSGESVLLDSRSYAEGGFELGASTASTRLSYRILHLPSNQSLLNQSNSDDRYTSRHSLLASTRHALQDGIEGLGWVAFEYQGGAKLMTAGVAAAWTMGEDSYFTGFKSATVVSGGLIYRTTGHLSPMVHVAWKRQWILWLAPDLPVRPPNGRAAESGMQLGLRAIIKG